MRVLSSCLSATAVLIAGLAGAASAQAGFVPALGSPFPYTAPTTDLAVDDGDRNGTLDVVAGGLSLRRGTGSGFLGAPITVGATGPVEGLASGDLDGDGLLDYAAVVPGPAPDGPRRLLRFVAVAGNGFTSETVIADAGDATDVAVLQANGDTLPDLAIVRRDDAEPGEPGRQDVTVVLGGSLLVDHYESGLDAPRAVDAADLDGDGRLELVVAGDEPSVSVLANEGATFAEGDLEPTGAAGATRRFAFAQLDGDGRLDLLATDTGSSAVLALLGDGAGGFQPLGQRAAHLPGAVASVAAGDVNGDGIADAIAGGDDSFAILLGDGRGGLASAPGSPFPSGDPSGGTVADIAGADMNRDGQLDVVTANRNGSVAVQLNDETGLLAATPNAIDFGTLLPATGTLTQTITLRSTRGQLRLTRLDRQGSRNFAVSDVDCLNRTLLLGQTCTVSVTFNVPRRARRYEALLSVDANAAAVVVPLSATSRPPVVTRPRLKRKRVKPGQRLDLRYRLSESALTRVLTERARPGRREGRLCVAPRRGRNGNLRERRCTLWEKVATTGKRAVAGANRMRVATRAKPRGLGRKRRRGAAYEPGAYRLGISALDRFGNRSDEQYVRFKVVAPKRSAQRLPARQQR